MREKDGHVSPKQEYFEVCYFSSSVESRHLFVTSATIVATIFSGGLFEKKREDFNFLPVLEVETRVEEKLSY